MISKVIVQYKKWKPSLATKNILYHWLTSEKKVSFGSRNENQTFYVIRSINDRSRFYIGPIHNLLANYFYVLSHIQYALLQGWTPIVDQLNYPVYNNEKVLINGSFNPWEYFWKQPSCCTLEEIYQSQNVVLSKQSWFSHWDMGYAIDKYKDQNIVSQFNMLAEIVPLNEATLAHLEAAQRDLFAVQGKILGVAVRYGGHAKNSLHHGMGHPIQPQIDELIKIVANRCVKWNMDYIFLASDEAVAVEKFRSVFGDRLLVMPRDRCLEGYQYTGSDPNPLYIPGNLYKTTLDYLTEMELLSRCNGLIGSITSGFRYAVIKNNGKYDYLEILDCGRFADTRRKNDS